MSEAMRTYQHFREVFGGEPRTRMSRARTRVVEAPGSQPFAPGRDPKPLADTIDALTTQLGWAGALSQHELLAAWSDLVGTEIAAHSQALAIDRGVLLVRCDSTAWATQLRLMRSGLLTHIAERFPSAGVDTIRFQGPDAPSWKMGPRSVPGRGPRDTYG